MSRFPLLFVAVLIAAISTSGCSLWRKPKAPKAPKPPSTIAAQTDEEFRQRWVDKRVAELMGSQQATDIAAARQRAMTEFAEKFPYTQPPKAKK